ncbi:MAG: alpha/beta hydrolase [Candidatus Heimdallarchaeaceae archaeon]
MKKGLKIALLVTSISLLLAGSLVVFVIIPVVGKNRMLHPKHEEMFIYPHDKGMTYENVTFTTSDNLNLKGWLVESNNSSDPNSNITVIILHGASHSKAFMLDHYGGGFYNEGYNLFLFDSRNRGESPDTELGVTWGIDEVKDIRAAVDFVQSDPLTNTTDIVLFAESQGSSTVFFYTSQYNDVSAIIVDSIWAYGDQMIKRAYPNRSGFPWIIFGQITIAMMESHYGFTFADISPVTVAYNISVPTFIIQGNDDIDFNPADSSLINSTLPALTPKLLWRVDGRGHVEVYLEPDYFIRISQFIADNV